MDINGENDSTEGLGREAVIEATTPAVTMPLDMKLSGMRIFTLEELCWYLAQNVYAITPELFDGKMFYWMDRITGGHSLALAIGNYQAAEKPLKEIVRLLLNSVDYLSNSEIARVYNQLTEMEHQNPVEQARLAADNYNRYGHPMAALKAYHHVVFQMEHDYESEVTRRFKAETWHNMGVAFLQLHHFSAAAECMSNAYELTRDKDDLEAWLHVLQLMGDQARILEITRQEGVPSEVTDGIMARYRQAEAAYADSERGKRMSAGLALKGEGQYEAFCQFVEEYLAEQKQRYSELR